MLQLRNPLNEYGRARQKIQSGPYGRRYVIDNWEFPFHFPSMADTVILDSTGRVVIPKGMRDELHLQAGDTLAVESDGERVTLSPVRPESRMRKEHGIWVFHGGEGITVEDVNKAIADVREARERSFFGSKG
jgi:AbrB family looped-hinge helix DNA binding protein